MLNKKKQIFSPKISMGTEKSALFNLPEFSKNSYIQILDHESGQIEDINLIFEKIISKRKDLDELDFAFRYSFSNLFFQKHAYVKLFSRQLIAPNTNFKESFTFFKTNFENMVKIQLNFLKVNQGGVKNTLFWFFIFRTKKFSF